MRATTPTTTPAPTATPQCRCEVVWADFLIAAHAAVQAETLLSRDRGYYRRGSRLRVIDPGGEGG